MHRSDTAERPALGDVLDALDDDDCRCIITRLRASDGPMTATALSDACDIPSSTLYRKLDHLTAASLVEERTAIRADGHHTGTYVLDFDSVTFEVDAEGSLDLDIERPDRSPDERLSDLWTEVRKET
ncbi:MAG: helix-turn-helix domain-containing protein [Haloarculaceae archaeon]